MSVLKVGPGEQFATLSAAMAASNPSDTFELDSDHQNFTLGSGTFNLTATGNGNLVTTGSGNDTVTLTGSGNVVSTGAGQNRIYEEGPGGNTIVTRAPGTGVNTIFGNAIQNGDVLDLRATLAATTWDGNPSDVSQYFAIRQTGTVATLTVSLTPGGSQSTVAVFENAPPNLSVSQVLEHAVVSGANQGASQQVLSLSVSNGGTVVQGGALSIGSSLSETGGTGGQVTMAVTVSGPGAGQLVMGGHNSAALLVTGTEATVAADLASISFESATAGNYSITETVTSQAGISQSGVIPVTVLQPPSGVLTVGAGEEYATIAAAVAASHAGDTIKIDAGTYTAADVMIGHNLTIEAVGGAVNVVPSSSSTINVAKGLFVVGTSGDAPNVTIEGLTFSGAESSSYNGAGIRYQSGNLTLSNDTFLNNQDGILATPFVDGTGSISIDHSTFDHNGAGDGQSHNMYIGYLNSFTLTNSVSENANVGHEVKSRAYNNVIENNQIIDGPTGTASYSIDLPNGGNDIIQGNTIEKGLHSSTGIVIHVGGPMLMSPQDNVTISGNTLINDHGPSTTLILNQMQTPVTAIGNTLEGFAQGRLISGYGTVSGSSTSNNASLAAVTSNDFGAPSTTLDYRSDPASHVLTLAKPNETVQGGAGHLTITSAKPGTVLGGSGGITFTETGAGAFVSTAAGSTNQITLGGAGSVNSVGNDTIVMPNKGEVFVAVTGKATITGSSGVTEEPYFIGNGGVATLHEIGGRDLIFVRQGGSLSLDGTNTYLNLTETDAHAAFDFTSAGTEMSGSLSGGDIAMTQKGAITTSDTGTTATIQLNKGTFVAAVESKAVVDASGGSATVRVNDVSTEGLTFIGGSGAATVLTGQGAATIVVGSGSLAVTNQSKVGTQLDFNAAVGGGTVTVNDFTATRDTLVFQGFTGDAIVSQSVVAGSLHLTLQNNTTAILGHTTHL